MFRFFDPTRNDDIIEFINAIGEHDVTVTIKKGSLLDDYIMIVRGAERDVFAFAKDVYDPNITLFDMREIYNISPR